MHWLVWQDEDRVRGKQILQRMDRQQGQSIHTSPGKVFQGTRGKRKLRQDMTKDITTLKQTTTKNETQWRKSTVSHQVVHGFRLDKRWRIEQHWIAGSLLKIFFSGSHNVRKSCDNRQLSSLQLLFSRSQSCAQTSQSRSDPFFWFDLLV